MGDNVLDKLKEIRILKKGMANNRVFDVTELINFKITDKKDVHFKVLEVRKVENCSVHHLLEKIAVKIREKNYFRVNLLNVSQLFGCLNYFFANC